MTFTYLLMHLQDCRKVEGIKNIVLLISMILLL